MNAFELAFNALTECDIDEKINQVINLHAQKNMLEFSNTSPVRSIEIPGRPDRPALVRFQDLPKYNKSDLSFIHTIHAICHIEFNAINLALDAIYRFQNLPEQFYQDWIQVAFEESQHFTLINNYLIELNYQYGDFKAHNGLWKMTVDTDYDVLVRMALVPRVLEARGLDVTPKIQKRFLNSKFSAMADILQIIFEDEIGHVKIGNTWFHYLCQQRRIDPLITFDELIKKHIGSELRGPFNIEARKLADFSKQELDYLQRI
ncbi:MAG: ferritin-like domain-containing protein [Gammaproteobacteria bacterium]|nr:ferritin-like domain-containing protein [Gammaproteobacteria bacterium]